MNYPAHCQYTMLISALPRHKIDLFDKHQLPISRIQLDKRLSLLENRHAVELANIESLLHWAYIKQPIDLQFVNRTLKSIHSVSPAFIQEIIIWRLKLRVIIAALRMRYLGQKTPPEKKILGLDEQDFIISKHWHQPDLGLGKRLPWIEQANQLLIHQQNLDLEKLLLKVIWEHYLRQSFEHHFNFEAVIIYVLRWDLVFRWHNYGATKALKRFDNLLAKTLQIEDGRL